MKGKDRDGREGGGEIVVMGRERKGKERRRRERRGCEGNQLRCKGKDGDEKEGGGEGGQEGWGVCLILGKGRRSR